jgi:hypothetical protein
LSEVNVVKSSGRTDDQGDALLLWEQWFDNPRANATREMARVMGGRGVKRVDVESLGAGAAAWVRAYDRAGRLIGERITSDLTPMECAGLVPPAKPHKAGILTRIFGG